MLKRPNPETPCADFANGFAIGSEPRLDVEVRVQPRNRIVPPSDALASRHRKDGGRPGSRTRMGYPTRPSNVRVYQFRQPPDCGA